MANHMEANLHVEFAEPYLAELSLTDYSRADAYAEAINLAQMANAFDATIDLSRRAVLYVLGTRN